jgi:IMP dehydrogenase/GMP reductase
MLGSMFAGCDECEGEWEYEYRRAIVRNDGSVAQEWWQPNDPGYTPKEARKKTFKYYGMSSKNAMDKHHDGVAKYRTAEGKCVTIPYKGKASEVIQDIYGGLRSACTYIGADKLKDFAKKTTFIQVNNTHNKIYET